MQLVNFTLRAGYEILVREWELDLHNCYDLVDCTHEVASQSASIHWRRSIGDWVDSNQPQAIRLIFTDVSRFESRDGDPRMAEDGQTIAFIGFLYPEDDTMDGYLDDMTESTQDMIVGLEDKSAIKIHAQSVVAEIDA